jgi:23S rRNA pseudouridine1911/1915/1917 synthase
MSGVRALYRPLMEILYEDDDIIATNKPAGLVVHPDGKTKEPSVSEWFIKKYPQAKDVGEPLGEIERPGIVHRIDRETSGVLLLAKTKAGHAHLKKQFQAHEVEKIYHAFLYGSLKEDHGTINLPIGKSSSDFRKRSAERGAKGEKREATTYYRVLGRGEGFTFVESKPKTGRTHQIRVHFKALHHPVVGDKLYAPSKAPILGFSRLALHARSVLFTDLKGQKHIVEAPYPEDFKVAVDALR